MGFVWPDFLDLAYKLCDSDDDVRYQNARSRTAISRAYYAAYHSARELLEARGEYTPPYGTSTHEYVRDEFRNGRDSIRQKIGLELDRLRQIRNDADYDLRAAAMTPKNALFHTERAKKVMADVKKLGHSGRSGNP